MAAEITFLRSLEKMPRRSPTDRPSVHIYTETLVVRG